MIPVQLQRVHYNRSVLENTPYMTAKVNCFIVSHQFISQLLSKLNIAQSLMAISIYSSKLFILYCDCRLSP